MLTVLSQLLLHLTRNALQEGLLNDFPKNQNDVEWLLIPQIVLLALF